MAEGVQIVYTDNIFPIAAAEISWPATYEDRFGATQRMPNPSIPIKYGYKSNSLLIEFESGHEQRRQKGIIRRTFEFTYNIVRKEVADAIEAFFFSCRGPVKAFNWTDPSNGNTYVCRFDGETFAKEYFGHSIEGPLYSITMKLVQVV